MIQREAEKEFRILLGEYPVVTVLGPRQSGKTTLVQKCLPDYTYVSLEDPDTRELATSDPRAFLKRYENRVIFDEIQRAPEILNYLQGIVDESNEAGQFVLTGSHQLDLRVGVTQSLAGRTAILTLYPLTLSELAGAGFHFESFEETLFQGTLPRVYDRGLRPGQMYGNYLQTYVERDVRQIINLKDASLFQKFLTLLAGRVGQLVDFTSLGNDVGVNRTTIRDWISILEASFIIYRLPPYFENFGKRVIKSPKFYFIESGLLCYLLGIEKASQVTRDPLVGGLFENLVVIEALKARANQGKVPNLYFFRDSNGNEIDLLQGMTRELTGIEIKSAATYNRAFKKGLIQFDQKTHSLARKFIVYNGQEMDVGDGIQAIDYRKVGSIFGQDERGQS